MSPAESPESKADEAAIDTPETAEPKAEMPYIYVRHVGRSAVNRASRHARSGHRRQGAILDNGVRIRKKGRYRLTKVALKEFVANHERLFFYIDNGIIEVIDPASLTAIPRDELLDLIQNIAGGYGCKVTVTDEILPPSLITGMTQHPATRPQDAVQSEVDETEAEEEESTEVDETEAEDGEDAEDEVEEELTEADLKKMNRKELDKLAEENDVNPKDFSTKDELIEALLEA